MHKIESRFRFLAADPHDVLQGVRPSYRETLLSVRDKLDVPCSRNLNTYDLETELFLHLVNNCVEYVQDAADPHDPNQAASIAVLATPPEHQASSSSATATATATAGRGAATTTATTSMPAHGAQVPPASSAASNAGAAAPDAEGGGGGGAEGGGSHSARRTHWTERVTAPLRFGARELLPLAARVGGAAAVTKAGQAALSQLATNLMCSTIHYQAAMRAAGGLVAKGAVAVGKTALVEVAGRGVAAATARYAAMRSAMSLLGPLMWGALAADLALRAIGTDYARVVRAVFVLAQVRLLRTQGFVSPPGPMATATASGGAPQQPTSVEPAAYRMYGDDEEDWHDPGAAYHG